MNLFSAHEVIIGPAVHGKQQENSRYGRNFRHIQKQHVAYNHKIGMKQINRKGIVADKHHDFRHMLHFGKQMKTQENHAC